GWVSFVLVVVAVIVAAVLTIVTFGGAAIVIGVALAAVGFSTALLKDPNLAPKQNDKEFKTKKCFNRLCTAKYTAYHRYYVYQKSKICGIDAPTIFCLKNAYMSPNSDAENKK